MREGPKKKQSPQKGPYFAPFPGAKKYPKKTKNSCCFLIVVLGVTGTRCQIVPGPTTLEHPVYLMGEFPSWLWRVVGMLASKVA